MKNINFEIYFLHSLPPGVERVRTFNKFVS